MKKRRPHCSHVSHFALCDCGHNKMNHADVDGVQESGRCTERRCRCESFKSAPGKYRPEQLEHESVPIEGYPDQPVPTRT